MASDPYPWNIVSEVEGWAYFLAWSISFYPQIVINYRRKSVDGFSVDFATLNVLGFFCYTVYAISFHFSNDVQADYKLAHHGKPNLVETNDVVFAVHALLASSVQWAQAYLCGYNKGDSPQRMTRPGKAFFVLSCVSLAVYFIAVLAHANPRWDPAASSSFWASSFWKHNFFTWISLLNFFSYIKIAVSIIKLIPQVYMNYKRKSTVGWSIENVLLDFTGGLLSVVQLLIDGITTNNWESVVAYPVKFVLGLQSITFDIIFMVQHYILYGEKKQGGGGDELAAPLLDHAQAPSQDAAV